jgi:hypothetical protein
MHWTNSVFRWDLSCNRRILEFGRGRARYENRADSRQLLKGTQPMARLRRPPYTKPMPPRAEIITLKGDRMRDSKTMMVGS